MANLKFVYVPRIELLPNPMDVDSLYFVEDVNLIYARNHAFYASVSAATIEQIEAVLDQKVNISALGSLAAKDSASGSYTPAGTVSAPNLTVTPSTAQITSVSDVGTLPTHSDPQLVTSVEDEILSFNWTAGSFSSGTLPTLSQPTTVLTGVSVDSDQPIFTGTPATITVS